MSINHIIDIFIPCLPASAQGRELEYTEARTNNIIML
jgi:hypothetical protein